jgi:hypothetical protein
LHVVVENPERVSSGVAELVLVQRERDFGLTRYRETV